MTVQTVALTKIAFRDNPIRAKATDLTGLMRSIKESGLINPLTLRKAKKTGTFNIVAGHRRFEAMKKLGWRKADVRVVECDEIGSLLINIAENAVRKDVTSAEEGNAFRKLRSKGLTVKEISARTGLPARRINAAIEIWNVIPKKHRGDVLATLTSHDRAKGKISYESAKQIINLRKMQGLTVTQSNKLIDFAKNEAKSKKQVNEFALALSTGKSSSAAKKLAKNVRTVRVTFVLNKRKTKAFETEYETTMADAVRKLVEDEFGDLLV